MKTAEEIREVVHCALLNLENLAKQVPGLAGVPMFKIVKYQLDCAMAPTVEEEPKEIV